MKIRKQKILIVLLAFLIAVNAFGQEEHEQRFGIHRFDSILQLTAEQKQEMKSIHAKYRKKHSELQEQKKQLRREEMAAVQRILTPEQRKQMRKMRLERAYDAKVQYDEIDAYRKEKIEPLLKSYRSELEKELSEDEKASIQMAREIQAELRKAVYNGHSEMDEHNRMAMKEKRDEMKAILRPVVHSHAEFLQNMISELSDEFEQWETDLNEKRGEQKRGFDRSPYADRRRAEKAVVFLLMEG